MLNFRSYGGVLLYYNVQCTNYYWYILGLGLRYQFLLTYALCFNITRWTPEIYLRTYFYPEASKSSKSYDKLLLEAGGTG